MKISASVFSNPDRRLEDLVSELQACGMDYIHIDCKDDLAVGEAIARIRKVSDLPIDLHLITDEPEKFYPMVQQHQIEMVTIQVEDLNGRHLDLPDLGCQFGIALMTGTPLAAFADFAEQADFVLFMTTVPGESGGKFNKLNFARIRKFRHQFPGKRIHVDGGVNAEISFVLRNLGVFCAVSGSFLVKAASIPKAFLNLLVQKSENHLFVRDIMCELNELPVLPLAETTLGAILQEIEDKKMGYCLLVDENGKLAGMVSNADVRRGLLQNLNAFQNIELSSMINPAPKHILQNLTVSEMLKYVKNLDFLVLNLPVTDPSGRLTGAVNFNQLILGEL